METANSNVLKFVSFNCRGFKNSKKEINTLCAANDVICLQEHWLNSDELDYLNDVHTDYSGIGVTPMDTGGGMLTGRPYGGVAIIWNKYLDRYVQVVDLQCNWACCIKISIANRLMYFFSVYMPYESADNADEFSSRLSELSNFLNECSSSAIYLMGDFNVDMQKSIVFKPLLCDFLYDTSMLLSDCVFLRDEFTYISDAWSTTSWLDHCICTEDAQNAIVSMDVLHDYITSDHLPLCMQLNVPKLPQLCENSSDRAKIFRPNWSNADCQKLETYEILCQEELKDLNNLNLNVLTCTNVSCTCEEHRSQLDTMYNCIVQCLQNAAYKALPKAKTGKKADKYETVPGWNDYVSEMHTAAREAFLAWQGAGKPRNGPVKETMRRTRLQFKYALRRCRRAEAQARADSLAKHLAKKDTSRFWKGIHDERSSHMPNPTCIDGITGEDEILLLWKDHYMSIFSSTHRNNDDIVKINEDLSNIEFSSDMEVSEHDMLKALSKLKCGKSPDYDQLSAEHFLYAKRCIVNPLCKMFTALLVHGYMPQQMMQSVIVPIVKNKSRSVTDKSNYRPIAISTILSKIFERVLLDRIEPFLNICNNQFGFKKGHGTELCCLVLKEIVRHYHELGSHMFICFLDASAAFDRLSHNILFRKLIDRGIPLYIVRILYYWYLKQKMCVKWNSCLSESFCVTNGVRQGGILSPHLFNLYMDNLSIELNKYQVGCCINGKVVNHLMYADDTVLVAPSVKGLQKLIDATLVYGLTHNIAFNKLKTVCMHVKGKGRKWKSDTPVVRLSNDTLKFVTEYKYLGHVIRNDLSDDHDMKRQIRSSYCRANMLKSRFTQCTDEIKVLLFKLFCANMYCCALWCKYTKSMYNKLRVAYNNSFRILLSLPKCCSASEMFVYSNVPNFEALLRRQRFSVITRVSDSLNTYVTLVNTSDIRYTSNLFKICENSLTTKSLNN